MVKHYFYGNDVHNLSSGAVRAIYKAPDGHLFVATDGGGLNILDEQKNRF